MDLSDITFNLENLKISAVTKYKKICGERERVLETSQGLPNNVIDHITDENQGSNECRQETSKSSPRSRLCLELEMQRKNALRKRILAHQEVIENFSKQQENEKIKFFTQFQQKILSKKLQEESLISQLLDECDKKNTNEHAKLDILYQKHRQQQEQLEADHQRQTRNLERMKKAQQEFRLFYEQILLLLKKYNIKELTSSMKDDMRTLNALREQFEETIVKCKNGNASDEDVDRACNTHKLANLRSKIESGLEQICNEKQQQTQIQEKLPDPLVAKPSPVPKVIEEKQDIQKPEKPSEVKPEALRITQYISVNNLKMYAEIMEFKDKYTTSFNDLVQDARFKDFRFDCKKAVNLPVNSLSGVNPEHILDKFNRLYQLLNGENIIVGDKQVNASKHPNGIAFCVDLLAKKFVLQADLMVSSNPESAFCYATVIISLWNEFPTFGKVMLAYLFQLCPYLVPYYIPRQIGESDEEFYSKCGYQYNNGTIEKQDKFLKRMTGVMRLFAAIIIVKPKRGQNKTPLSISQGWNWIASLLKLEPQVDITATMLHTFLETAGFAMEAHYGKQFQKLVRRGIVNKYLPVLQEKCTGGAITRLQLLLNEYMKKGAFEQPPGYVGHSYW